MSRPDPSLFKVEKTTTFIFFGVYYCPSMFCSGLWLLKLENHLRCMVAESCHSKNLSSSKIIFKC